MLLAFLLGLQQALNPFALATTLVYVTVLSAVRHTRFQLIISGVFFIGTAWLVNFFVLSGSYDELIYRSFMEQLIVAGYGVLAGLFIVMGAVHLRHWWRQKKTQDGSAQVFSPRTLSTDPRQRSLKNTLYLILLCAVSSGVLSLLEARLTQNYYLFIVLYRQMQQSADWRTVLGTYFSYMLAYTIVLTAFWLFCVVSSGRDRMVSLERVVYAAVYLAVGMGLTYYLLRVVQF